MSSPPDTSAFKSIQEAYRKVKSARTSILQEEADVNPRLDLEKSGFFVPVEIRACDKGRGLFVKECVRKNQKVWDAQRYCFFTCEKEWRTFLSLLPTNELRRDVISWSYVMEWDETIPEVVGLDLDEASLINHGSVVIDHEGNEIDGEGVGANVESRQDEDGKYFLYALRDIQAGEELLCDYSSFHNFSHKLDWYDKIYQEILRTDSK